MNPSRVLQPNQKIKAFLGPENTDINPEMALKAFEEIIR